MYVVCIILYMWYVCESKTVWITSLQYASSLIQSKLIERKHHLFVLGFVFGGLNSKFVHNFCWINNGGRNRRDQRCGTAAFPRTSPPPHSTTSPPRYLCSPPPNHLATSALHHLTTSPPPRLATSLPRYLSALSPCNLSSASSLYRITNPRSHYLTT